MSDEDELTRLRAENDALRRQLASFDASPAGLPEHPVHFLKSLVEAVPAFVLRLNRELRLRYINRLQPGNTLEQVLGLPLEAFIPPEFQELARSTIEHVLATGEAGHYSTVGAGANGQPAYYESYVARVVDPDDSYGVCLVAHEITEHRARQRALEESEQKLRLAVEATGIGLWNLDTVTGEVSWDERMHEITGSEKPLGIEEYVELVHPDDRARVELDVRHVREAQRWSSAAHRLLRSDGSIRWVLSLGQVIREGDRVVRILGGNLDVTEPHLLEEKLRESQKLQAVGSLTAGIAHNFNNLMAGILPALDMLTPVVPDTHQAILVDATHAAGRASELVRQLMTFTGQRRDRIRTTLDVSTLVERALRMCRRTFDRHITLEAEVLPDLPLVRCDPGAIDQILLNLLLNARDAVQEAGAERGRIVIDARLEPAPTALLGGTGGPFVCIRVTDDGAGMSDDVRAKIFEPFFTTKPVGRGTGLGLATSFAIAREHGGTLDCTSSAGAGSTFSLYLPAAEGPVPTAKPKPPPPRAPGIHVLVVDDEAIVRHVVQRSLSANGYRVSLADGGEEALQQLDKHRDIAVILLDRSMPEAPGERVIPRLRASAPGVKIILYTGQSVEPAIEAQVDGVLNKPTRPLELHEAICETLAGRRPQAD